MLCQIVEVEQNSDEWLALRRGRINVSRLGDVMAKPSTKRFKQYHEEKVLELLGHTEVEDNPEWYRHGRDMEPRALGRYDWKYGTEGLHNLYLIHGEYRWLGYSPDWIDKEYTEAAEFKSRKYYRGYREEMKRLDRQETPAKLAPASNRHQIQGGVWMTGFQGLWYVNYYEDQRDGTWNIDRVWIPRDQKLIDAMEERCLEFITSCYEAASVAGGIDD
jgi:hypothetical protein